MVDRYLLGGTVAPTISGLSAVGRVNTIAALTALSPTTLVDGLTVVVLGYYAAGDGGGGEFWWDAASSATDNGGTIIAPTAGGVGRWKALGDMTPARFGLVGVDVTANKTLPAVTLYCPSDEVVAIRSGAVLDLSACTIVAAPDAEFIDMGGGYVASGAHYDFTPYSVGVIEGGRVVFAPNQQVYANWFNADAGDIGHAWNRMHYCNQQNTLNAYDYFTEGLVGQHTVTTPMFGGNWGSTSVEPKRIVWDCVLTYAPTSSNDQFPCLDFTHVRNVRHEGICVIIGDSTNKPDYLLSFQRNTSSPSSHATDHDLSAFELRGNAVIASLAMQQTELNRCNGMTISNVEANGRDIVFIHDPTVLTIPSKYADPAITTTTYNAGFGIDNLHLFTTGGTDSYTSNAPDHAAILLNGPQFMNLRNCFAASAVTALHITTTAPGDNAVGFNIEGFQQHPQSTDPDVAVCISINHTIAGGKLEITRDSADVEALRIIGPASGNVSWNNPTIIFRQGSTGDFKAYAGAGNLRLLGITIIHESTTGVIDLSACQHVSGRIYTANPTGVVLPSSAANVNVIIEAMDGVDTGWQHDHNLQTLWFETITVANNTVLDILPANTGTLLTDSTGGAANNTLTTLSALTDSPASADALRDELTTLWLPEIENNLADLAAKINVILAPPWNKYVQPFAGVVLGAVLRTDAAISAGTISVTPQKDAAGVVTDLNSIAQVGNTTNPRGRFVEVPKYGASSSAFAAGETLGAKITTSGLAGPTKIQVGLVVAWKA